jgi:hypothetical protein
MKQDVILDEVGRLVAYRGYTLSEASRRAETLRVALTRAAERKREENRHAARVRELDRTLVMG